MPKDQFTIRCPKCQSSDAVERHGKYARNPNLHRFRCKKPGCQMNTFLADRKGEHQKREISRLPQNHLDVQADEFAIIRVVLYSDTEMRMTYINDWHCKLFGAIEDQLFWRQNRAMKQVFSSLIAGYPRLGQHEKQLMQSPRVWFNVLSHHYRYVKNLDYLSRKKIFQIVTQDISREKWFKFRKKLKREISGLDVDTRSRGQIRRRSLELINFGPTKPFEEVFRQLLRLRRVQK